MVPPSQGRFSTNWKSAEAGSKRQTRMSEIAKVMSVVHSATQRALRAPASSSRSMAMNSAPTSGRKVTTERIGQLAISAPPANMNQVMKAATPISMAKA